MMTMTALPELSPRGWNTMPNGRGATYTAGSKFAMGGETVVLYALWSATVSFDSNGGSGTMPGQEIFYNVSELLTANIFTRTGSLSAGQHHPQPQLLTMLTSQHIQSQQAV